jgi:nucleotide sugar dehydrogenase
MGVAMQFNLQADEDPPYVVATGSQRPAEPAVGTATDGVVAVVGLGYVGLPTALGFRDGDSRVIGLDTSRQRLETIRLGQVDLLLGDQRRLHRALLDAEFLLTPDSDVLPSADAVVICVPTPVDEHQTPDLTALRAACQTVVSRARAGQLIVLTSTTVIGATRDLLVAPLQERGLVAGRDINVAFSPERIDPGRPEHLPADTPRVVGGATEACTRRARGLLSRLTDAGVHEVRSPEVAEMVKLHENAFRAVNLALANELAEACRAFQLDPVEVIEAAATKPFGYLPHLPGPGVGGHCIPCDPHYLTHPLRGTGVRTALVEQAMDAIAGRPAEVVTRAALELEADGHELAGARVLVVGAAYKPAVRDVREAPALDILRLLAGQGADVAYHDPLIPTVDAGDDLALISVAEPDGAAYDLAIVAVRHPGMELAFLDDCPCVVDCTYRIDAGRRRVTV